jgi:hypothetical protein
MLFIILLDSRSSVFTFTVAFSLAPLDRCDRRGGDGLRSSSDSDEAEPLSSDTELSESLSESENFLLLLAFRSSFFPVGTRILIFFALDPKIVPKLGKLRLGNNKTRETG